MSVSLNDDPEVDKFFQPRRDGRRIRPWIRSTPYGTIKARSFHIKDSTGTFVELDEDDMERCADSLWGFSINKFSLKKCKDSIKAAYTARYAQLEPSPQGDNESFSHTQASRQRSKFSRPNADRDVERATDKAVAFADQDETSAGIFAEGTLSHKLLSRIQESDTGTTLSHDIIQRITNRFKERCLADAEAEDEALSEQLITGHRGGSVSPLQSSTAAQLSAFEDEVEVIKSKLADIRKHGSAVERAKLLEAWDALNKKDAERETMVHGLLERVKSLQSQLGRFRACDI